MVAQTSQDWSRIVLRIMRGDGPPTKQRTRVLVPSSSLGIAGDKEEFLARPHFYKYRCHPLVCNAQLPTNPATTSKRVIVTWASAADTNCGLAAPRNRSAGELAAAGPTVPTRCHSGGGQLWNPLQPFATTLHTGKDNVYSF